MSMSMSLSQSCSQRQEQRCRVCDEPSGSRARFSLNIGCSSAMLVREGICPICLSFPKGIDLAARWAEHLVETERRLGGVRREDGVLVCPTGVANLPLDW